MQKNGRKTKGSWVQLASIAIPCIAEAARKIFSEKWRKEIQH